MTLMPGSFRNRLALLCGGLALIVGLPAYLYINHVYAEQLLNERGHAIHELATAMSAVLAESLNERRREIELLSDTRLFRREPLDDSAFRGSLERLQNSYPQYSWIGVADLDGVVQAATHDLLLGQNVAQRPWFAGGLDGVFVGDLHEALLLAKLLPKKGAGPMRFIDIAVPVSGEDGQVRGVLAAHVHWDWAGSVLRVLRPSNAERVGMDILIVNGQGDVIYPEDSRLVVPQPSGRPTQPGFFIDNWSGTPAYVTSMAPVREIIQTSPLGWQVVIRQPLDRVMEDVVALRKVVLGFALLAVAILLLLSWVVASRLSQPLERLATLARRIEKGDEGVTLEVGAGSVELRHLVDALRGMAATLIQRREALEASNRDLEHKVIERTAELARLNDELRDQARRDALTGLPNRLAANERLRDEFVRMRRSRKGYAVLVADIDHFKRINDGHGHPAGDAVLRHVAVVLKAALRESDFVARFGGEEFLLLLIALVPLLSGDMPSAHFSPMVPIAYENGLVVDGAWNMAGVTLMAGGLFIAAWSTYGFETAVCYTREFKDPKKDTFKAIFYSGLLCIVVFTLVPLAFQGHLGLGEVVTPPVVEADGTVSTPAVYSGMLAPDVYSGMGVANVMSHMVGGGEIVANVLVVMLVLAVLLSIMTSMAGSSRTLYQASVDGWLPRYLSYVNEHGAPTRAMWTDLGFNLILLLMSDYVFVLACSNVGYIMFNFLNLNSGWIHRIDRPDWERPFKAPKIILGIGVVLGFVNLALMGLGADIYGAGTLTAGLVFASLIIPVFLYRHYVQDKGKFPDAMLEDMHLNDQLAEGGKRAGILPYITLAAGVAVVIIAHNMAVY